MCSVHSRTGHRHALRLVRLAARQLTAVAQPLQGPVSSARSCVPLRMRSITTGVSHLYRADPSSGHQAPMLVRDAGGCDDGSATRYTCSHALSSLADSDPKARSALRIRKEGKSIASTGKPGPNQRTCAFCPSVCNCNVHWTEFAAVVCLLCEQWSSCRLWRLVDAGVVHARISGGLHYSAGLQTAGGSMQRSGRSGECLCECACACV